MVLSLYFLSSYFLTRTQLCSWLPQQLASLRRQVSLQTCCNTERTVQDESKPLNRNQAKVDISLSKKTKPAKMIKPGNNLSRNLNITINDESWRNDLREIQSRWLTYKPAQYSTFPSHVMLIVRSYIFGWRNQQKRGQVTKTTVVDCAEHRKVAKNYLREETGP